MLYHVTNTSLYTMSRSQNRNSAANPPRVSQLTGRVYNPSLMATKTPLITITCLIQIRSRTHSPGCRPLHIPDNLHCCSWSSLAPPSPQVSQVPALSPCSSERMKPNPGHFAMTSKGADNFHAPTHFILTSGAYFCPPTLHTARELASRLIFSRQSQYSSFLQGEYS